MRGKKLNGALLNYFHEKAKPSTNWCQHGEVHTYTLHSLEVNDLAVTFKCDTGIWNGSYLCVDSSKHNYRRLHLNMQYTLCVIGCVSTVAEHTFSPYMCFGISRNAYRSLVKYVPNELKNEKNIALNRQQTLTELLNARLRMLCTGKTSSEI